MEKRLKGKSKPAGRASDVSLPKKGRGVGQGQGTRSERTRSRSPAVRKVNQKVEGPGIRGCLADWAKGVALPSHCVYMGRTMGTHGRPLGWGNPFRVNKDTESEREIAVVKFGDYLRGKEGRWLRYRLHELMGHDLCLPLSLGSGMSC